MSAPIPARAKGGASGGAASAADAAVNQGEGKAEGDRVSQQPIRDSAAACVGAPGERKTINSELWHACAGPLVSLPAVGSLVVYFPQGHSEQVAAFMHKDIDDVHIPNYPSLPWKMICILHCITLHADAEVDEVYAQMTLQPVITNDKEVMLASDFTPKSNKPLINFFCKTLTASDTSTHGGFSVPRPAAEKIFPPLDYSMQPPSQELQARDLHDNEWAFRHIYRGQPKRHLLTTGWSSFMSGKRLISGDSVLFIRDEKQQLLLGTRRANRQPVNITSSVLSSDTMHIGILAAASHAATSHSPFTVFYNPRASPSEFVIPLSKYQRAVYCNQISVGSRFQMLFETEESEMRKYMGTITAISDLDPVRWKSSQWRNLQVGWDESTTGERRNRVSIWEIEPVHAPFFICPPPFFQPSKRTRQSGMPENEMLSIGNLFKMATPWLDDDYCFKDADTHRTITPGLSLVQWLSMQQNPLFGSPTAQPDYLHSFTGPQQLQQLNRIPCLLPPLTNQQFQLPDHQIQLQQLQKLLQQQQQQQQLLLLSQSIVRPQLSQLQEQQRTVQEASQIPSTSQWTPLQQTPPQQNPEVSPMGEQFPRTSSQKAQQKIQPQQVLLPELPEITRPLSSTNRIPESVSPLLVAKGGGHSVLTDDYVLSSSVSPSTNNCSVLRQSISTENHQRNVINPGKKTELVGIVNPAALDAIASSSKAPEEMPKPELHANPPTDLPKMMPNQGGLPTRAYLSSDMQIDFFDSSSSATSACDARPDGTLHTGFPLSPFDHQNMFRDVPSADNELQAADLRTNVVYGANNGGRQEPSSSMVSQSFAVPDVAFNSIDSASNDNGFLYRSSSWAPAPQYQRMRTYTKVYKHGAVGRSIDISRYSGYDELRFDLALMFGIDGQLEEHQRIGWKLVYEDHEKDILLVGDDPWEEFVSCVRCIRILSPWEVQQMSLDSNVGGGGGG